MSPPGKRPLRSPNVFKMTLAPVLRSCHFESVLCWSRPTLKPIFAFPGLHVVDAVTNEGRRAGIAPES
jgi:hypothetical protein